MDVVQECMREYMDGVVVEMCIQSEWVGEAFEGKCVNNGE